MSLCLELNFDMQICTTDKLQRTGGSKVADSLLNETQGRQNCPLQIHFYMKKTSHNILLRHLSGVTELYVNTPAEAIVGTVIGVWCVEIQFLTRHTWVLVQEMAFITVDWHNTKNDKGAGAIWKNLKFIMNHIGFTKPWTIPLRIFFAAAESERPLDEQ